MRFSCPLIVVKEIARSIWFYRDLLGQKIKFDFGENVTFEGDFAIHLESHYSGLLGSEHAKISYGSNNFELYFESDDLDRIYSSLINNQVQFVHPIMEQPWKQRVMRFFDPDRHIIEVGETLESVVQRLAGQGLSVEQIHTATSLPYDFIQQVVV